MKKTRRARSEPRCASYMYEILRGAWPLTRQVYTVEEVAQRYGVHRDTAYKGIRSGDPMYPRAEPAGDGPRPRLLIRRDEIAACDRRRLEFYRTTPSWHKLFREVDAVPPPRRSARAVLAEAGLLREAAAPDVRPSRGRGRR
jgi:transposase